MLILKLLFTFLKVCCSIGGSGETAIYFVYMSVVLSVKKAKQKQERHVEDK
jgi:hypothetical protein